MPVRGLRQALDQDPAMALPKQLLDIQRIYLEPAIEDYARGREILAKYPDAERIPVESHWKIPELHGNEGSAEDWLAIKRATLVLGIKKGLTMRPKDPTISPCCD